MTPTDTLVQNALNDEPAENCPEVSVDLATRDLMNATDALFRLGASKAHASLVRREANHIELAYSRLGRLLSRIRQPDLRVVG